MCYVKCPDGTYYHQYGDLSCEPCHYYGIKCDGPLLEDTFECDRDQTDGDHVAFFDPDVKHCVECRDGNNNSDDGCYEHYIEHGWYCEGGSSTSYDYCYVTHYIDYIAEWDPSLIKLTIGFNTTVLLPDPIEPTLDITIEGPLQPYAFTYNISSATPAGSFSSKLSVFITPSESILGEENE